MRPALLAVALLAAGCGEKHPTSRTLTGDRQQLEFTLQSEDRVGVGLNYFDVSVKGPNGAYTGDDLVASAHSLSDASNTVDINVQRMGQGRFLLLDVPLSTPGEWVISVSGDTSGGWKDSARFELAVK